MRKKEKQGRKWNDRGGALVTVVVVTAFISILVTIILYASGMNYYMKTTDKRNKDSFYEAEIVMESIKANLMTEAKTAFQEAYQETLITFASNSADDRKLTYNQTFANAVTDSFNTHVDTGDETVLQNYLKAMAPAGCQGSIKSLTVAPAGMECHEDDGYVLLKDVVLEYQKGDYYSKIKTDFMVKVPKIDWSIQASAVAWGGNSEDLVREEHDMADCVIYYNWEKE